MTTLIVCSGEAEMTESIAVQCCPADTVAKPPLHGHGWPQACVPDSTAHVMGGGLGNLPLVQCTAEPTDSVG